ncbi:MAG: endonuclease/exonuclease/phosphatase family protein [Rhodopirellula sp.]|nr:endonuclease/exonuclease/phosphatase family protein [Rhodopirellula sp.]
MRVLTYNIHHAEGVDRKLDLERIASVINGVRPDVVALQEVDHRVSRTQSVDQPAELSRLTKMHVVFGDNIQIGGGKYGNAILSRFPVTSHKNHRLPNRDDGEQRGVIEVTITIPDVAQPLVLFATHLDHRSDDQERFESAQAINSIAAKHAHSPALLAGDLNDTIDNRTLREFTKHWTTANDKPLFTVPVSEPERQIDFILYRSAARWKTIEMSVLPEAIASDHRAVLAVIELLHITDKTSKTRFRRDRSQSWRELCLFISRRKPAASSSAPSARRSLPGRVAAWPTSELTTALSIYSTTPTSARSISQRPPFRLTCVRLSLS